MTNAQFESFMLFKDNQDMAAINQLIANTEPVTAKARQLKDEWITWWDDLTWLDKNVTGDAYDKARNKRNEFLKANAVTAAEKEAVRRVQATGATTEEVEAGTNKPGEAGQFHKEERRATSEGKFPEKKEPLIPTQYKIVGFATAVGIATLAVLKKLHII
jgi:murein L,D-transpeptidase YafK